MNLTKCFKTFPMKIVGVVEDDNAQAVILQLPGAVKPEEGKTPHITVSTSSGTNPQYSNDLIAHGQVTHIRGGIVLRGTLAWWDGTRARTDI